MAGFRKFNPRCLPSLKLRQGRSENSLSRHGVTSPSTPPAERDFATDLISSELNWISPMSGIYEQHPRLLVARVKASVLPISRDNLMPTRRANTNKVFSSKIRRNGTLLSIHCSWYCRCNWFSPHLSFHHCNWFLPHLSFHHCNWCRRRNRFFFLRFFCRCSRLTRFRNHILASPQLHRKQDLQSLLSGENVNYPT